jgi:uncharacterized coiled-coil protein SlyX
MRKVPAIAGALLVLSLAFAAGAEAKCSVTCLSHRVKQLSSGLIKAEKTIASLSKTVGEQGKTIAAQGATISQQGAAIAQQTQKITQLTGLGQETEAVFECLFEAPLTEYGEPEEEIGYLFKGEAETFPTTALDITEKGDFISAWFLFDACNETETLSLHRAAGAFPGVRGPGAFSSQSRTP